MNKQIISFSANEQILKKTAGQERFADDVVGYIEAHFDLGDNWTGYDSIRAVWFTAFAQISTVLDQDGVCLVPPEVCNRKEAVNVNLVGSIANGDELTDRLTTYPIVAFIFDGNARVDGTETAPITPSQFEQYVAIVEALVGSVRDIDHATLNADYTLTIYYSDGTSDTVGPIRGEQGPTGPTGNGIASIAKTGTSGTNPVVDTYTITYTNGQTATFTVTNGVKGDTGNGIQSIYKTGTAGAVDTYTILYTDGNTTEFTVTNGEVTNAVLAAAIQQAKEDLVDQFAVKDTASGSIASFPDGADWPAKNVLADINPIQDLHGYDKPWSGGAGENILDPNLKFTAGIYYGVTLTTTDGYNFSLSGTATDSGNISAPTIPVADCVVYPAGTYTSVGAIFSTYKPDGSWYANRQVGTWTADEPFIVRSAYIQIVSGTTPPTVNRFLAMAKGSTAPISWTPYSNICPISGHTECVTKVCGKNLLANTAITKNGDTYFVGATTVNEFPFYLKAGIYTFSSKGKSAYAYWRLQGTSDNNIIHAAGLVGTITLPQDGYYRFWFYSPGSTADDFYDIQLEVGSTATDYEPYNGNTYTVSWQTEAGTVYGGTIDVVTGVLTVETVSVSAAKNGFGAEISGTVFNYRNTNGLYPPTKSLTNWTRAREQQKCNMGNIANPSSESAYGPYVAICYTLEADPTRGLIRISEQLYQTMSDSDRIQVIYKILTPTTYQLTPTEVDLLLGMNNVWADTGDVEVTYVTDTKLYIDKMTA